MLAAKFSTPYAVAAALVLGRTDVAAFGAPALADPRIRDLARRVTVTADPAMSPRSAAEPTARVRILLSQWRSLEETTAVVRGDALVPVPDEEVVAKFLALAAPVLGDRAGQVVTAVLDIEAVKDVRDLTALLASP
jgi:2-methylcitrate dehydratase PrpD